MRFRPFYPFFVLVMFAPISVMGAELKGTVVYHGKPIIETVKVTADRSVCGETLKKVRLAVNEKGQVADAVVWLEGVGTNAKPRPMNVEMDQKGCQFVPWIIATSIGSKLVVYSSDTILHNAHGIWEDTHKTAFNVAVPMPGMTVDVNLDRAGRMQVRCDAGHTWMEAHILVFDHPYFAKTDANGSFVLKDVPPGSYTLHVWHPVTGEITQSVKVPGTITIELPVKGS